MVVGNCMFLAEFVVSRSCMTDRLADFCVGRTDRSVFMLAGTVGRSSRPGLYWPECRQNVLWYKREWFSFVSYVRARRLQSRRQGCFCICLLASAHL
jgi:hypothetical protein